MLMLDRKIVEGERAPLGYGLAWVNWHENTATFIIIPFNWIACFFRWLYFVLRKGHPLHDDMRLREIKNQAFNNGKIAGRDARNREIEANISAFDNGHLLKIIKEYINGERQQK